MNKTFMSECTKLTYLVKASHTDKAIDIDTSHDGKRVALVYADNRVIIREMDFSGQNKSENLLIKLIKGNFKFTCIRLSRDGEMAVTGTNTGEIFVFFVSDGKFYKLPGHKHKITSIDLSWDKHIMIAGAMDGSVSVYVYDSNDREYMFYSKPRKHKRGKTVARIGADGRTVVSGGADKKVCCWTIIGNSKDEVYKKHTKAVNDVAISNNNLIYISGSDDNSIREWTKIEGLKTTSNRIEYLAKINRVAFSSDGGHILSVGSDGYFKILSCDKGRVVHSVDNFPFDGCFALSEDSRYLYYCIEKDLFCCELQWRTTVNDIRDWTDEFNCFIKDFIRLKKTLKAVEKEGWTEADIDQFLVILKNSGFHDVSKDFLIEKIESSYEQYV